MDTPQNKPTEFGKRLRAFRLRRGWTQEELARRAGITRPSISLVESGKYEGTTVFNALKLADALGVSLDQLMRGDVLEQKEKVGA